MEKVKDYSKNNLDVTHYKNGDPIPEVTDAKEWKNLTTGAWCYYDNDPTKGILYNWYAVNDPRGLVPKGYSIPTDKEMESLNLFDNQTYDGYRTSYGTFYNLGSSGNWWSSSEGGSLNAWGRNLNYVGGNAYGINYDKRCGFSVRCLRDVNPLKCKDCNDLLENCTCIEDTVDFKQETLEEAAEIFVNNRFTKQICGDEFYPDIYASKESIVKSHVLFTKMATKKKL